MISRDAAVLAVRALDDLLVGLASGVLAAQRRIAEASGVSVEDLVAATPPGPTRSGAKARSDVASIGTPRPEALATSEPASPSVAVPDDVGPLTRGAYVEGARARAAGADADANPYQAMRGVIGGRRKAWARGWEASS